MEIVFNKGWYGDIPDGLVLQAGGLKSVVNAIPFNASYYPVFGGRVYNTTPIQSQDGQPLAFLVFESSDLIKRNYLFLSNKFYRFTSSQLSEISCYQTEINHLSVTNYGNWIVVSDGASPPKVLKSPDGNAFENLAGNPPYAKYLLFFKGHLILANIVENGIAYPKRIRWSARENIEDWTPSLTTGSDFQDFPDSIGQITGLANLGDVFAIFFENSITVGSYSGGVYTYNFIHNAFVNIGCPYPKTVISIGKEAFFWGIDSIYKLSKEGLTDIGYNRLKKTLFSDFNKSQASKLFAIYDYERNLVMWAYPSGVSNEPDSILVYNVIEDAFTKIKLPVRALILANFDNPESLDSYNNLIDEENVLIDDPRYTMATIMPMFISQDNYISYFGGNKLKASFEFAEIESFPDIRVVDGAKLRLEGVADGQMTVSCRYSHGESKFYLGSFDIKQDQTIDFRVSSRLINLKLDLDDFDRLYPYLSLTEKIRGKR